MKIFLKLVLTLSALAALIAAAYFLLDRPGGGSNGAGFYDVNTLKKTDPALLVGAGLRVIKPQMSNLTAIAVDRRDNIYAGSRTGITILDSNGVHVSSFTVSWPVRCLAVAPDDDILAGVEDRVEIYAFDGTLKKTCRPGNAKAAITSIAASSNFIFAADSVNRIVWRFDRSGEVSGKIGERDNDRRKTGFVVPGEYFDLAVAPDGSVWVTNPGEHRLEHFADDGRFLSCWGRAGLAAADFCGCCNPGHIALTPDGMFVTGEKHIVRVKLYDSEGAFKGVICGQEDWAKETAAPDIAVDSRGRILALDPRADAIRVYSAVNRK